MNKASFNQYCFRNQNCRNHQHFNRFNLKSYLDKEYTRKIKMLYCVKIYYILDNTIRICDIFKNRIVQLSQICPYCKKKCYTILATNCKNGYKICQDCFIKLMISSTLS